MCQDSSEGVRRGRRLTSWVEQHRWQCASSEILVELHQIDSTFHLCEWDNAPILFSGKYCNLPQSVCGTLGVLMIRAGIYNPTWRTLLSKWCVLDDFKTLFRRCPKPSTIPALPSMSLCKNDGKTILHGEYRSIDGKILYFVGKSHRCVLMPVANCRNTWRTLVLPTSRQ